MSDCAAMVTPADLADLLECEHRSILKQAWAAGTPGAARPAETEVSGGRASTEPALVVGREVVEIDDPDAAEATRKAMRSGAPVIRSSAVTTSIALRPDRRRASSMHRSTRRR